MARKAKQTDEKQDFDLTDTFMGQSFNNEITKFLSSSLPGMTTDFSVSNDQGHDKMSRSQLSKS